MGKRMTLLVGILSGCLLTLALLWALDLIRPRPNIPKEMRIKEIVRDAVHDRFAEISQRYYQGLDMDIRQEIPKDQIRHDVALNMQLIEETIPGMVTRRLRHVIAMDESPD